uniref:Uncharacterized protein n=1 Tax=Branchiostoma floridae TaxID=7739 RepID=C3Y875_BRAFL|eukprot:XP_002607534.1 hypothetical protein BRAFLDRAFT_106482 [Branchiostoma floridae]
MEAKMDILPAVEVKLDKLCAMMKKPRSDLREYFCVVTNVILDNSRANCERSSQGFSPTAAQELFSTKQTVGHTNPSAENDIREIREMNDAIVRGNVYTVTPGRRLVEIFTDPVAKGMKRIAEENWIQNFLQKESVEEQQAQ